MSGKGAGEGGLFVCVLCVLCFWMISSPRLYATRETGWGGPQDSALGLVNVTKAAQHDGSDVAAYILGNTFFHGYHGLPKDPLRARPWLEKVVRGRFYLINLSDVGRARAAEMLRELGVIPSVRWVKYLGNMLKLHSYSNDTGDE